MYRTRTGTICADGRRRGHAIDRHPDRRGNYRPVASGDRIGPAPERAYPHHSYRYAGDGLLPPHLAAFHAAQPGIELEVIVSDTPLDLTRREADVALRIGNAPQEILVGRRVGRLAFGAYASADRTTRGIDDDLASNDWIGFGQSHGAVGHQLADWLPGVQPIYRTNSIAAAIAAARAGIGLAPLPCAVADGAPDLVRVAMFPEDFQLDLWLLTHEDLRNTARIRAFMDFMAGALATDADLLEGRRPQTSDLRTGMV